MIIRYFYALFLILVFFSCRKEELPISKKERGEAITTSIDMGDKYVNQVWFNLSTAKVISTNNKLVWDMAFSNNANDLKIKLNTSKLMQAAFVENGDINQNYTPNVSAFKIDHPTGNADSLAFSDWQNKTGIYVIDLGFNELGTALGKYNFEIVEFVNNKYRIRYRNYQASNIQEKEIATNSEYNYQYFSFTSNNVLIIEPKKSEYDILFTQYTNIFYNPYQPYLVSGILLNPNLVKAYQENNITFENFKFENIEYFKFSHQSDIIGYDWKFYNFDNSSYDIVKNKLYIIQNNNGDIYKLHFLDFYNESGKVGVPLFQIEQIF
jgi:hypothetical protein